MDKVLSQKCEGSIPRSGKEAESVDCYSVRVNKNGKWYLLLESIEESTIQASEWDGERYCLPKTIDIEDIPSTELNISHKLGLFDINYHGYWQFILGDATRYQRVKTKLMLFFYSTKQYLYNKQNLASAERMELLQYLVDRHIKTKGKEFTYIDVMTDLNSSRWIFHPDKEHHSNHIKFVLQSLLESEDLISRSGIKYEVSGKAMTTLSEYQLGERRYLEGVGLRKRMIWLTIVLAAVGLIQAFVMFWTSKNA